MKEKETSQKGFFFKYCKEKLQKLFYSASVGMLALGMSQQGYAATHQIGPDKPYTSLDGLVKSGQLNDYDTIVLYGDDASLRKQNVTSFTYLTVKSDNGQIRTLTQAPGSKASRGGLFYFNKPNATLDLHLENLMIRDSVAEGTNSENEILNTDSGAVTGRGGAIFSGEITNSSTTDLDMSRAKNLYFINNSAFAPRANLEATGGNSGKGGAIFVSQLLSFEASDGVTFEGNLAHGGGVDLNNTHVSVVGADSGHGGAIFAKNLSFKDAKNFTFKNNKAIGGNSVLTNNGGVFITNYSGLGGAIGIPFFGSLDMTGAENFLFIENVASGGSVSGGNTSAAISGRGGAIFSYGDRMLIEGASFYGNKATTANNGDMSSGLGGAIFVTGYNTSTIETKLVSKAGKDIIFSGNTHNPGNTGETPNSIYFGAAQPQSGTAIVIEFEVITEQNSAVYMYDPMGSQADNQAYGITGGILENIELTINKTGLGEWVLGGYNDMRSKTTWNVKQGALALDVVNSQAAIVDLSNATTADFTLDSGAKILLTPYISPHFINANNIDLAAGSIVDVNDHGSFTYYEMGVGTESPLLSLRSKNPLTNDSGILRNGDTAVITSGMYDYTYHFYWDILDSLSHDLMLRATSKTYNRETGGSDATTAPEAIASQNVLGRLLNKRILWNFECFDECEAGFCQRDFSNPDQKDVFSRFWGTSSYNYTGQSGGSNFDIKTPGLALGYDKCIDKKYFIGGAIYASFPKYSSNFADIHGKNVSLAVYGGTKVFKKAEFSWLASFGYSWYSQNRDVRGARYGTDYNGHNWLVGMALGRTYKTGSKSAVRPFVDYQFMRLSIGGYNEGSGTYSLNIASRDASLHFLKAGFDMQWFGNSSTFQTSIYYSGLYGDTLAKANATFTNDRTGTRYVSFGDKLDKHALGVALESQIRLSKKSKFVGNYTFEKGKSIKHHYGSLNFIYNF